MTHPFPRAADALSVTVGVAFLAGAVAAESFGGTVAALVVLFLTLYVFRLSVSAEVCE